MRRVQVLDRQVVQVVNNRVSESMATLNPHRSNNKCPSRSLVTLDRIHIPQISSSCKLRSFKSSNFSKDNNNKDSLAPLVR